MGVIDSLFGKSDPDDKPEVPADTVVSPDVRRSERIPPGQVETARWPVLDASGTPKIDMSTWRFEISGAVERPWQADWETFRALPASHVLSDFHCVTRWSRLDNRWEGALTRTVMEKSGVLPSARYVLVHGYDGAWSTNLPLEDFLAEDAIFAWSHDGEPLEPDHGGPLRLVIPRLYAWKSAKWVREVELLEEDYAGYWENGGYHMRGDPWKEQRYRWS